MKATGPLAPISASATGKADRPVLALLLLPWEKSVGPSGGDDCLLGQLRPVSICYLHIEVI